MLLHHTWVMVLGVLATPTVQTIVKVGATGIAENSALHSISMVSLLAAVIVGDISQVLLALLFVLSPVDDIEIRLLVLQPLEHGLVLYDDLFVVAKPLLIVEWLLVNLPHATCKESAFRWNWLEADQVALLYTRINHDAIFDLQKVSLFLMMPVIFCIKILFCFSISVNRSVGERSYIRMSFQQQQKVWIFLIIDHVTYLPSPVAAFAWSRRAWTAGAPCCPIGPTAASVVLCAPSAFSLPTCERVFYWDLG